MINRNFGAMKSKVGGDLQDTSSGFLALIGTWLNDRYYQVLRKMNHSEISRFDYEIAVTAGTEDYVLPSDCIDILSVFDKTNKVRLTQIDSQEWVHDYYESIDSQGNPINYILIDDVVKKQPTSASLISFISSSSSDTTQIVYVRGIVDGVEDYETVNLSGTASVATTKQFSKIYGISKSTVTQGYVTVTSNSGAVENGVFAKETLQLRYKKIRLAPIPANSLTLEIVYAQKALPMSQSYDYPTLECEDILEAGAMADGLRYKRQYAKADYWERIFESRLDDLTWASANKADKINTFKPIPYNRDF